MRKSTFWSLVVLLASLPALAMAFSANPTAEAKLAAAQADLAAQRYPEAIAGFEGLLAEGYRHPGLYHNLGLAHYQAGRIGWAIFYFRRGLRLWTHQADLLANLQWVRLQQVDEQLPAPDFFLLAWWRSLAGRLSSTSWAVGGVLAIWLAAAGLAAWLLLRQRRRALLLGIAGLLLGLLCFSLAATREAMLRRHDTAVVVAREVALRIAPATDSEAAVSAVHDGLELKIIDRVEGWYKLSLPDGRKGWAPAEAVAVI